MKNLEKIIAVVGPTASGKTDIAVQIAKKVNGEIISADSRLVYKDFNIGTAKPNNEEMQNIKHHMIDIADPKTTFAAGKYKLQAEEIIKDILSRNKTPIIAGGTGFYVKSLLEGLDIPNADPDVEFREEMRVFLEVNGKEALYNKLLELDPETANKLHVNDSFRIIRALEVQKTLGVPMSQVQTKTKPEYDILYVGLNAENRDYLYDRINKRVDIMIQQGLIEEVQSLINKYGKTLSLLKTLGYKEICEYLDGMYSLEQAIENIKKNTRNFAKRQLTWFRANKEIHWFYIDKQPYTEVIEEIVKIYDERI